MPWQLVCEATGATLKHVGLNARQEVDIDDLNSKVTDKTKLVALVHVSNVLGSALPAADAADIAHRHGAQLLLDCCQSVPHMPVDVQVRAGCRSHFIQGVLWAKHNVSGKFRRRGTPGWLCLSCNCSGTFTCIEPR